MMKTTDKDPFLYSWEDLGKKSPRALHFHQQRELGNVSILAMEGKVVPRFYNIDHNAYLEGALTCKTKELLGLVASAVLRCDDCITYHILQSYRLGTPRKEIQETLEIALVIGGSIFVPHLRRASLLLDEIFA